MADFLAEFTPSVALLPPLRKEQMATPLAEQKEVFAKQDPEEWKLFVDGSACNMGSGTRVVIFPPGL